MSVLHIRWNYIDSTLEFTCRWVKLVLKCTSNMELAGAYTEVCLETDIFRNGNGVNFKLVTTL